MLKWMFRNDGHAHCFSDKKRDHTLEDGTRVITMACNKCGLENDHVIKKMVLPNESQALYHEQEARKCEAELRNLIQWPALYEAAYTQTMRLIEHHRQQSKMCRGL